MTENQSFQLAQIDLFNGMLKIFKTSKSDYYYMKVSIPGSNNGFRKSLKTKDESLARQLAEKEYLAIRYKLDQGISVFEPKLSDLEKAFLKGNIPDRIPRNEQKGPRWRVGRKNDGIVFRRLGRRMDTVRNFGGKLTI